MDESIKTTLQGLLTANAAKIRINLLVAKKFPKYFRKPRHRHSMKHIYAQSRRDSYSMEQTWDDGIMTLREQERDKSQASNRRAQTASSKHRKGRDAHPEQAAKPPETKCCPFAPQKDCIRTAKGLLPHCESGSF